MMKAVKAHSSLLHDIQKNDIAKDTKQQRERFMSDHHSFAKKLFTPRNNSEPTFTKSSANKYFKHVFADECRDTTYEPHPSLPRPAQPTHKFVKTFPSFAEFPNLCRKKKNNGSPGLNGIPYIVYKKCEKLRRLLWMLLRYIWRHKKIPTSWQQCWIRLLDKGKGSSSPEIMRPISVLNVEGRLFCAIVHYRLAPFLVKNGYIKIKDKKAFIDGIAGCIEQGTLVYEALRYAVRHQTAITVAWLDLANAYGSVNHM
jgi:hypothetical protein